MNYILHLNGFYDKIQEDHRLNPTHISLYMALFQFWNINRFQNPISISRVEMMKVSKIAAFGTYHKCIKQLQEYGYIEYIPSFNPYKGSLVNLLSFGNQSKKHITNQQALYPYHIKKEEADRQALKPSINSINKTNHKHGKAHPSSSLSEEEILLEETSEKVERTLSAKFHPPSLSEVKCYFEEKEASSEEAEKFFNHYESNGWLVGGKAKMKNWQAAARNWLLNAKKFNKATPNDAQNLNPKHLHATTKKNYTDPL